LALHASPQFDFVDVVDVEQPLGSEPAPGDAQRGDLVEQPILGFGGQVAQQPFGDPGGRLSPVESGVCQCGGQSSRKSIATARRTAVGCAPNPASVAVLNSITRG
jgi:hypothetical protein